MRGGATDEKLNRTEEGGKMLSSNVEGQILDWHWEKRQTDYLFFVGDIYIGQVFKMPRDKWSALHRHPQNVGLVDGFKSRYDASHFLLKFEEKIGY